MEMDTPVAIYVLAQRVVLMCVPGIAVSADCCLDVYLSEKRTVLLALALALALCYKVLMCLAEDWKANI